MKNIAQFQTLTTAELHQINGGKDINPYPHNIYAQIGLGVVSVLAGIADGLTAGLND